MVTLALATVTGVKWVLALLVLDDLMDLVDPEPWRPRHRGGCCWALGCCS